VEDAVDYPPNQAQSLYANVNKSKNGSANYPDVVHDVSLHFYRFDYLHDMITVSFSCMRFIIL